MPSPANNPVIDPSALKRLDWNLVVLGSVLLISGILFIYGAGQQIGGRFAVYWGRQVSFSILGIGVFVACVIIDYRILGRWSWLLYLGSLGLLVLVLTAGIEINNARSWLDLGVFTLQPAELVKPAVVMFLAWLCSRTAFRVNRILDLLVAGMVAALPIMLIARQPDYGTALVFVPAVLAVLFLGGLSWRFILIAAVIAMLALPLAYNFMLAPHQRDRIQTFLKPSDNISDAGWNAHQSLLAVGSGGFSGKGYMKGTQHVLGYLPQTVASTDFIFSVIGEETGFIGAGAVVCAFIGILICCLRAAANAPDRFGSLICAGISGIFLAHVYVNIGMTVRAAPIIGIPLPFLSYGGSFMLGTMICLGLVQSVYARR
ncbi:MAG: rod shape-determining protein RodA [Lentisphaeria bacterium]